MAKQWTQFDTLIEFKGLERTIGKTFGHAPFTIRDIFVYRVKYHVHDAAGITSGRLSIPPTGRIGVIHHEVFRISICSELESDDPDAIYPVVYRVGEDEDVMINEVL